MNKRRFIFVAAAALSASAIVGGRASAAVSNPTSVAANSKDGTASATISWTIPAGATRYRVKAYIGTVAVKSVVLSSGSQSSYTFTGLELDMPYALKVTAGDGSTWGSEQDSTPLTVTPKAAAPSAPAKPSVEAVADSKLEVRWTAPTSTGGALIEKYSVQLRKGDENVFDPFTTTSLSLVIDTKDNKNQFSVRVKAINTSGLASPESEDSDPAQAVLKALTVVTSPPAQDGGGNQNQSGGGNSGGNNQNSGSGGNTADSGSKSPSTPVNNGNSSQNQVSTAPPTVNNGPTSSTTTVSYSKSVSVNSATSRKSLLTLSRLTTPKGAKVAYVVLPASKKYCTLTSTVVKATKTGTCSVKVTVTVGKKSSTRTVKLYIGKKASTAAVSRAAR